MHSSAAASVESKLASMQHKIFAFVRSLKLSRRLLCSVRFVFVLTFTLKREERKPTRCNNIDGLLSIMDVGY